MHCFSVVEEDELQPLNEQHKSIRRSSSSSKSKEDDKKEKVPSVPYRKLVSNISSWFFQMPVDAVLGTATFKRKVCGNQSKRIVC